MGTWFPNCGDIDHTYTCGIAEFVITQKRYCEFRERNSKTGMCQIQKTNSLELGRKLSCQLDAGRLSFQRDFICQQWDLTGKTKHCAREVS